MNTLESSISFDIYNSLFGENYDEFANMFTDTDGNILDINDCLNLLAARGSDELICKVSCDNLYETLSRITIEINGIISKYTQHNIFYIILLLLTKIQNREDKAKFLQLSRDLDIDQETKIHSNAALFVNL